MSIKFMITVNPDIVYFQRFNTYLLEFVNILLCVKTSPV